MPPTESTSRDPFGAPAEGWRGVSTKLATVRRISVIAPVSLVAILATVAAAVADLGLLSVFPLLMGLLVSIWVWWVIGRQVAAMGYALRGDDLVVVSGILFRRLVVVPYGRMQLVDVTSGPMDRRFGLASVQLHTAAATTDASVPGLPRDDAADLRDRLAALGERRSAGL